MKDVPKMDAEVFALPLPDRLNIARMLVPEYVVVPREPTEAMLAAFHDAEPLTLQSRIRAALAAAQERT